MFIFIQKIKFIPHLFEILLRNCWLVSTGTLGMLYHPYQKQINLKETVLFMYKQKINLIPHLFLGIVYFKESCNLREHFRQIKRSGVCGEMYRRKHGRTYIQTDKYKYIGHFQLKMAVQQRNFLFC